MKKCFVLHYCMYDREVIKAITADEQKAKRLQEIFPELDIAEYTDRADITDNVYKVTLKKDTGKWSTERDLWADWIDEVGNETQSIVADTYTVVVQAKDREQAKEIARNMYKKRRR